MTPPFDLHVVVPGDLESRTGGYAYDRRIIAGLRALGWSVSVVSIDGGYPFPTADDRRAAASALAALADDSLVVVDGLALGALPAEAHREQGRLRLVGLVHHPLADETGLTPEAAGRLRESERRALAATRGVIVTSNRTVEAVEAMGISRARIAVVEPGTDPGRVVPGSGRPDLQMLCVASVVPRKGHDVLFEALTMVRALPWRLACVGSLERDRAWVARLVRLLAERGLSDRVTLTGELEGDALDAAYQAADLFVLATHYEGYGMAVAEALARGIPVLSTDTGGIVDLVGDRAGVLVRAGDVGALAGGLRRLMTDAFDLARLRRGALAARTAMPTWEAAVRQMGEALVRLGRS